MKRICILLLLLVMLCGCAAPGAPSASSPAAEATPSAQPTPTPQPLWEPKLAEELLASGAFEGSEMAPLEPDIAALLLGLDAAQITEGIYYMAANTSVSADELLILVLTDEAAAIAAEEACRDRVASQIKVCKDYCPAAVPRLEEAVIVRRGNSLLYAVGDPAVLASLDVT